MVDDDNLAGSQELLRDDDRAEGIDGAATCVADDMGIPLLKAKDTGRVQAGVHAGHDEELAIILLGTFTFNIVYKGCSCHIPARRERQITLGELRSVLGVGRLEFRNDRHDGVCGD